MISKEFFRYYPLVSILVFYTLFKNTNNAVTALTFTLILFSVLSLLSGSKNIEYFYETKEEIAAKEKSINNRMKKLRKFCKTNKKNLVCKELKKIKNARDYAFNAIEKQCAENKKLKFC